MTILNREVQFVQNPALGAMLLWHFAIGYEEGSRVNSATPIPLLFIVLPIAYHEAAFQFARTTRRSSGLRAFAAKFFESKVSANDQLLTIHTRSLLMRNLTIQSIKLSIMSHLISIDYKAGVAIPLSSTPPKTGIPNSIRDMLKGTEKLGYWCAGVSLHEVSAIMKVSF
ncbi:MAG: three component ABC system middle component [Desulfobaccales bacterium]|jgi:hypothetical protein